MPFCPPSYTIKPEGKKNMTEALEEALCSGEGDSRRRSEQFCRGEMQWEAQELPTSCAGENHHPLIITPKRVKTLGIPRDTPGLYLAKGVGRNKVPSQARTPPPRWQSPRCCVCQVPALPLPCHSAPIAAPRNAGVASVCWQQAAKLHRL